ncbi:hypothetical protein [uncultured Maricaulis sp.]|uniref:ArnT family glycosyltransferase n=1 Tax=uncultured Maricaulis sp. TaxID=174710 RepID=UPI0030D8169F|tara:strand:- start:79112 stop:80545 length:1434 start_codon:yes stop_codon:yes gene_type:complete
MSIASEKLNPTGTVLAFVAILILALWLRLPTDEGHLFNIDEVIPVEVSKAMIEHGNLNPNWALANLPDYFRYDQYNFYFYMIIGHLSQLMGDIFDISDLTSLRFLNIICSLLTITLIGLALRNFGLPRRYVAITGVVLCFAPTLVFDAAIARPESLTYFVVALGVYVVSTRLNQGLMTIALAAIIAMGVAIKVTMAVLIFPLLILFLFFRDEDARSTVKTAALFGVAFLVTLFVIAPYAFINYETTIHGFLALREQYNGLHPPHSLLETHVLSYTFWILRFFLELYGFWFLFATVGFAIASPARRVIIAALLIPFFILLIYFGTKTVFFERNFAHTIPLVLIAGIVGLQTISERFLKGKMGVAIAAIALIPGVYWSLQIAESVYDTTKPLEQFEAQQGLTAFLRIGDPSVMNVAPPPACGQISFRDYNDAFSRRYRAQLQISGYREVNRFTSRFAPLAGSTLQTYLESNSLYFQKNC